MNISYKRDMTHNYMVPDLTDGICEEDYRIHMLMENHIRGLLPCCLKRINCQSHFFYDITSRQSMTHIYENNYISADNIRTLLHGLYRTLKEVKKYLLDIGCIVLETDMIYMDIETKEPLFCYLPGYQGDMVQSFRSLTSYLLEHLDQSDSAAVLLGYDIYRKARIENYSLEKLLQEAAKPAEPKQAPLRQSSAQEGLRQKPAQIAEDYRESAQAAENYRRSTRAAEDYRQSARAVEDYRQSARAAEDYHQSTQAAEDYRYTASRSSPMDTEKSFSEKSFGKNAEKTARKKKSEKKGDPKKQKEKKPEKKPLKKKKSSRHLFLITCFGFALLLSLAAMWLWGLDTTQIGGIIFLLVALLAYGFSLEEKKKKKAEKREEAALSEAMEEFEEEPFHAEPAYYENPAHYREASYLRESPARQDSPPFQRGPLRQDSSHLQEPPPRQDSSHYHRAPDCTESSKYDTAPIFFRPDEEKSKLLGNTGVLYEENGDYEPHLVLISMDPRQKDSIILEDDCYIVGKLASQSDIVLEHSSVSRVHAKIERHGNDYYLCDLNSTNGTFLNGKRLSINERAKIHPSDEISFARACFHVGRC